MKAFKITIEEKYGRHFITANLNGEYARYEAEWVGDDFVITEEVGSVLINKSDIKSILDVYGKLL